MSGCAGERCDRLSFQPMLLTGGAAGSFSAPRIPVRRETSRFKPLPCHGTFFQLVDYSAITTERDIDFAQRLTREHGVAAIPISPFLSEQEEPGPVVRFCFAKRDETLRRAAERLQPV